MKITNIEPQTTTLYFADGTTGTFHNVITIIDEEISISEPQPPRKLEFVDCKKKAADVNAICAIIARDRVCKILVIDPFTKRYIEINAIAHIVGLQDLDDLILESGYTLQQRYWGQTWKPNPSWLSRAVHGYWK